MSIPGRPSLQERSIRARRLKMIKLTETREGSRRWIVRKN